MSKRACGFILFRRYSGQIQYLLLRASYKPFHWSPPKGHVDLGEDDLETAFRETQEEAGLAKADLKILEDCKVTLNYEVKAKPKCVIYWLAELLNLSKPVTLSQEHTDFKWLTLKEACDIVEYPDMQGALKTCDTYVNKNLA